MISLLIMKIYYVMDNNLLLFCFLYTFRDLIMIV